MIAFFHGLIGIAAHWTDTRSHLPPATRMNCFAPELDYAGLPMDGIVADMRRQLLARKPRRLVLCGNSIGCVVALRLADIADEVILAGPPFDYDNAPMPLKRGDMDAYIDSLVCNKTAIHHADWHHQVARYKLDQLMGSREGLRSIRRLKGECQSILTDTRLGQYQDKITVALGGADYTTPPARVRPWLAERAPRARLTVLPDVGHTLPLEAPQVLAKTLTDAHGVVSALTPHAS